MNEPRLMRSEFGREPAKGSAARVNATVNTKRYVTPAPDGREMAWHIDADMNVAIDAVLEHVHPASGGSLACLMCMLRQVAERVREQDPRLSWLTVDLKVNARATG